VTEEAVYPGWPTSREAAAGRFDKKPSKPCIGSLKWFRRPGTRHEKLAPHYRGTAVFAIIFRLLVEDSPVTTGSPATEGRMTEPTQNRFRCNGGRGRAGRWLAIVAAVVFLEASVPAAHAADPADSFRGLNLIPWPQTVRPGEGRVKLTGTCRIVAAQKELEPLAKVLSGEVASLTGLNLHVASGPGRPGDIVLQIDRAIQAGEPILAIKNRELTRTREGAYRLTVGDRVRVEGFDYRAIAEGTSTLLQAIGRSGGEVSLPRLEIHDWPHADYCAMLVDVARQDHPIAWLEKMIEVCRFYRVRYLQLHLTDDQGWTFPSRKYPQLGSRNYGAHGGVAPKVYTLDELKGLVAYADARGVTLVPELEMPGHSGAALRSLPEVFDAINPTSKQPVGMGCMNMANEEIYPALDAIIGEMCEVFRSSPYFHIGGDEVSMGRVALHPGYKAFMAKHGLKDDADLGKHFTVRVNEIVKKHGKKTIKWEGLANEASRDIVVMAWVNNNQAAGHLIARGFTTITCPWGLGVPWEDWNMYICNGSRLKKGDPVLGATLVAWEQPPLTHLSGVRNVASRQERTWNPDHTVTVQGFAARFQALDAAVGKLIGMPVKPHIKAAFTTASGTRDWLEPVFAFDGNDATFYRSDRAPSPGDHFTVQLEAPRLVHAVEVLTGINNEGLLEGGEVQISRDGANFKTIATLKKGLAQAVLTENRVRAIRIVAKAKQADPLIIREIRLRLIVEVSGVVKDPARVIGEGNLAALKGDTTVAHLNDCAIPIINKGFTLALHGGGSSGRYGGPITGTGTVEIDMGARDGKSRDGMLTLAGKEPNTLEGTWVVKAGRLALAKEPGIQAIGGTIVVGGQGNKAGIVWNNNFQVGRSASIRLLKSARGGAYLDLNGFSETVDNLTMDDETRILTDGSASAGVLTVGKLVVAGQAVPRGVYTSPSAWIQGGGYVVVGDVRRVKISGKVDDPRKTIGEGNIAVLEAASVIELGGGDFTIPVNIGVFPLTLSSGGAAVRHGGFITGKGPLRIEAASAGQAGGQPLEIVGRSSNSYKGPTRLVRGVLKLSKPGGAIAIPGDLELGGSAPENRGDGVIWGADGQLSATAVVTLAGSQPSFLDLAGHKTTIARLVISRAGAIRTGEGGSLQVKQLHIDGKRLKDGVYRAPQPWLSGSGTATVDARVDVQGRIGDCTGRIGLGNIANLTGNTQFCYPVGECSLDVITNGHTLTLDSGDGNPLNFSGTISGTGDVALFMGPSHTDYKDAPLRLSGGRANTTTGKFYVRKGRVQLEKPDGVDAISGDVIVGGQGFNDCLFWMKSNQIKDSANITLIGAGNNGAAYLHLNGCNETVASLTMVAGNTIRTDSAAGAPGVLTVKSLVIDGVKLPAGSYTSASAKWIVGKGKVIVQP
jgi:hexosaminidase